MAIGPSIVLYRGTRRVRVLFTGPLGAGAFTSSALYALENLDGSASNPIAALAVFAIGNNPNAVEFAVDSDLVSGALYRVGFSSVPAQSGPAFTGSYDARVPLALAALPNQEPQASNLELLLYRRDLVYRNGFQRGPTGDLLTQTGRDNWVAAVTRRVGSTGLPWDASYGVRGETFVDAPDRLAKSLGARLIAQAIADDRTASASVVVAESPSNPNDWHFRLSTSPKADPTTPEVVTIPVQ